MQKSTEEIPVNVDDVSLDLQRSPVADTQEEIVSGSHDLSASGSVELRDQNSFQDEMVGEDTDSLEETSESDATLSIESQSRFDDGIPRKRSRPRTATSHRRGSTVSTKPRRIPLLTLVNSQKLKLKSFLEVRAERDVERFLDNPTILLDLHQSTPLVIVDAMLTKLIENKHLECSLAEARDALFIKSSVECLAYTIVGTEIKEDGERDSTHNWLVAMAELSCLQQSRLAIARLKHGANLGPPHLGIHFVILVLTPRKTKTTKSSLEEGRTFATLMSDMETRQLLLDVETEEKFKTILAERKEILAAESYHRMMKRRQTMSYVAAVSSLRAVTSLEFHDQSDQVTESGKFGQAPLADFKRRWPFYVSDFVDGVMGHRTLQKLLSTVLFLYFACLLPSIAFGVLNSRNTAGRINVQKVIISQAFGGGLFALFGGQPMVVLLTTVPLALYVKVIYSICEDFELDFLAMFCCVGLWNSLFLVLYSMFGLSHVMRWSTRSTEEIFALFIALAFFTSATKSIYKEYTYHSDGGGCVAGVSPNVTNGTMTGVSSCHPGAGVLYVLLSIGTVWMGASLYNFRKSPYLDAGKREVLADYALVAAVLFLSFVGSYIFRRIPSPQFEYSSHSVFIIPPLSSLPWTAVVAAAGLGFSLSILFFMAHNIVGAMVNSPRNKLKKGTGYHWDLLVVAAINAVLSLFGQPWVHGALPHSPLHVRALADLEEHVDQGHIFELIVKVRETRLSGLCSHILVGLSLLMLPVPLVYIPPAVLDGLFLFVAVTSLNSNQLFERALLLLTEQTAYPPSHYIRRVPQRIIHTFTLLQLLQLAVLCAFGFSPVSYMRMVFPVLLIFMLPIRHKLIPKLVHHKYLDALDAHL